MRKMRAYLGTAVLIAILVVGLEVMRTDAMPHVPATCCTQYATKALKFNRILTYVSVSSSNCAFPGVIFITKKGQMVCANPSDPWVKDYVERLDKSPSVQQA
uniref:Gp1 n=1 Tax=Caviid herpesvirus 2 str. CIDMTR TaxID=1415526 RepID=U6H6A8_9BETA|nr:gp1 [Caviid herpesvirus 2 str. CIDMTR]